MTKYSEITVKKRKKEIANYISHFSLRDIKTSAKNSKQQLITVIMQYNANFNM